MSLAIFWPRIVRSVVAAQLLLRLRRIRPRAAPAAAMPTPPVAREAVAATLIVESVLTKSLRTLLRLAARDEGRQPFAIADIAGGRALRLLELRLLVLLRRRRLVLRLLIVLWPALLLRRLLAAIGL